MVADKENSKIADLIEVINLILEFEELRGDLRKRKKVEREDVKRMFQFARDIKATVEGIDRIPPMDGCTMSEIDQVETMMESWRSKIKMSTLGKIFG